MRTVPVLVLTLVALALGSVPAGASTTIVRPNATTKLDLAWAVTTGKTADAVLADAVTHTGTPSTSGDQLVAGFGPGSATVRFPAPSLPAGATPSAVTAWVYASVGILQLLTPSVWSGSDRLAQASWTPGSAAWHSIALSPAPTADQLAAMTLELRTDGLIGITNTHVYAAYLQVDAASVDRTSGPAVTATGPATGDTADPAGDDAPAGATAAPTILTAATVELTASATAVPVSVTCPAGTPGGCRGRVVIQLAPAPAKTHGTKARAARCGRGCRVIGDSPFTIAAGKQKPVRVTLRKAAYKMLPRGKTVKVRVTVSSRNGRNRVTSVTRTIAIHRARF
jgi:hypothetical protein